MLPDFPIEKAMLIQQILEQYSFSRDPNMGPLQNVPGIVIFEGQIPNSRRIASDIQEVGSDELATMTREELEIRIRSICSEINSEMFAQGFGVLMESLRGAGRVSANQSDDMVEPLFSSIENTLVPFDEKGRPQLDVHGSPEAMRKLEVAYNTIQADPTLRRRWSEMMIHKREEWRVSESNRELAG